MEVEADWDSEEGNGVECPGIGELIFSEKISMKLSTELSVMVKDSGLLGLISGSMTISSLSTSDCVAETTHGMLLVLLKVTEIVYQK